MFKELIESYTIAGTDLEHLDIEVDNLEGYLTLKFNLGDKDASFTISSCEEIDQICHRLKKLLKQAQSAAAPLYTKKDEKTSLEL